MRLDHRVFQVFNVPDEAQAADHVLDVVHLDGAGADVDVRLANRVIDLGQGHAVCPHRVRIHVDLVLADEPTHRGDLADSLGRLERVADVPVLRRAQLVQVPATGRFVGGFAGYRIYFAAFQRVPEDLAQGSGIRSQRRSESGRQLFLRNADLLQNPRTRPVEIDIFLEHHVDAGETEKGIAADRLHPRHAQQRDRQRVGDLIFHVLGRAAHPAGEHNLLVFADVGNGVHRDGVAREPTRLVVEGHYHQPPTDDRHKKQEDDQLVLQAKTNHKTNHSVNHPARGASRLFVVHFSSSLAGLFLAGVPAAAGNVRLTSPQRSILWPK